MSLSSAEVFKKEAVRTEWIARNLWPWIRPLFKKYLSPRCKRCVNNVHYSRLNEEGLCEHCLQFHPESADKDIPAEWSEELHQLLANPPKTGGPYDALLLFSGGKDSSYMLHRLRNEYSHLRILLLFVDNGFLSPVAIQNAESVAQRFSMDFVRWTINKDFVKKVFQKSFHNIRNQKSYSIVDLMDGQMTFDTARNLALHMKVPIVLCGLGRVQLENVYGRIGFEMSEDQEKNPFETQLGKNLTEEFTNDELSYWYQRPQDPSDFRPRFVMPLVVWDPSEEEILKVITEQGMLELSSTSPLVTNNQIIPLIGISEVNLLGYSTFEIEFSKNLRAGKIERSYWLNLFEMLELSAKTGKFLGATIVSTLERLHLTSSDLGWSKR
ncbi:MAG: hypothetical protein KDD61_04640 [Bdellovibrionales bacterium]|nr:hypothetical protein [Bdellovibrionales bacterium]